MQKQKIMPNCLRCGVNLNQDEPQVPGITFFSCPDCASQYSKEPGQELHDRWLVPLSLPLYAVIFDEDPAARAREVANQFLGRSDLDLDMLEQHIEEELKSPKQRISEIHDFVSADEDRLRDFLRRFSEELKTLRGRA